MRTAPAIAWMHDARAGQNCQSFAISSQRIRDLFVMSMSRRVGSLLPDATLSRNQSRTGWPVARSSVNARSFTIIGTNCVPLNVTVTVR